MGELPEREEVLRWRREEELEFMRTGGPPPVEVVEVVALESVRRAGLAGCE